jgi:hypothetical protein
MSLTALHASHVAKIFLDQIARFRLFATTSEVVIVAHTQQALVLLKNHFALEYYTRADQGVDACDWP